MGIGAGLPGEKLGLETAYSAPKYGLAAFEVGNGEVENMGGGKSKSGLVRNGFSGKRRSSTLGPKVLGLLFGLGKDTTCPGSGETSIGGGIREAAYGVS